MRGLFLDVVLRGHSLRTPVGHRRPLDGSDYPRSKASQAKSIALDCCTKVSSCSAKSLH